MNQRSKNYYYLHPEFVTTNDNNTNEIVTVCSTCERDLVKSEIPKYAVKNIDFGSFTRLLKLNHINIRKPTFIESLVIASVRLYGYHIQLSIDSQTASFRGHCIALEHDATEKLKRIGQQNQINVPDNIPEILDLINIIVIGNKACYETYKLRFDHIKLFKIDIENTYNIIKAIKVLQQETFYIGDSEQTINQLKELQSNIIKNIRHCDDVRTKQNDEFSNSHMIDVTVTNNNTTSQSINNDIHINQTYSCIQPSDNEYKLQYQVIKKINELCNPNTDEMIISITSYVAINEFTDSNQLLYNAFPLIFLLSKSLPIKNKPLDIAFISHLLKQKHLLVSDAIQLIFFLSNQLKRHSTARYVNIFARNHPRKFKEMSELIETVDFKLLLSKAVTDPFSEDAKKLINLMNPYISIMNMP